MQNLVSKEMLEKVKENLDRYSGKLFRQNHTATTYVEDVSKLFQYIEYLEQQCVGNNPPDNTSKT